MISTRFKGKRRRRLDSPDAVHNRPQASPQNAASSVAINNPRGLSALVGISFAPADTKPHACPKTLCGFDVERVVIQKQHLPGHETQRIDGHVQRRSASGFDFSPGEMRNKVGYRTQGPSPMSFNTPGPVQTVAIRQQCASIGRWYERQHFQGCPDKGPVGHPANDSRNSLRFDGEGQTPKSPPSAKLVGIDPSGLKFRTDSDLQPTCAKAHPWSPHCPAIRAWCRRR